jgi:uncharacterized protein (TIGR00255 family)
MTGFGAAFRERDGLRLDVETRSVNHKHLKFNPRVPEGLGALVPALEGLVRKRVTRGTVYLVVRQSRTRGAKASHLNKDALESLYRDLLDVATKVGADPPTIGAVALLPGVVELSGATPEAELSGSLLKEAAAEALDQLDAMRVREGEGIGTDLRSISEEMLGLAGTIDDLAPKAVAAHATRLKARVAELLSDVPKGNLDADAHMAREIALLADKSDISEELQRLRSHIDQLNTTLDGAGPVGRKLEFLAQELLRESNTMASKLHDTELVQGILELKLCVERIREQAANLE